MSSSDAASKAAEEKLQKRAALLSGIIRKFLIEYRQHILPPPAAPAAPSQHTAAATAAAPGAAGAASAAAGKGKGKPAAAAAAGKAGGKEGAKEGGKDAAAKGAKDPKATSWATFLGELDDRINKSKRCNLEDLFRAVDALPSLEQQALYQIVTITGPALLPVGMNEASSAVKDMLFAAAAAAQYSRPAPPPSSCSSAGTYRERGLDAQAAYLAGFTVSQLLAAGYTLAEVAATSAPLSHLRAAGIGISELVDTGLAEALGLTGAAGASKLREAGYTPDMLATSGALSGAIGSWDMKLAGLVPQPLPQLRTPPAPAALPAALSAAAVVVNPRGSSAGAAGSQDPGAGEAAPPQQQQVPPPRPSVRVVSPAAVEPSHHHQQQQQRGAPALVLAGTEEELRFFRKGIKGVMQLKPGQGIQPVILGTAYSTPDTSTNKISKRPVSGKAAAADAPPPTARASGKARRGSWLSLNSGSGGPQTPGAGGGSHSGGLTSRVSSSGNLAGMQQQQVVPPSPGTWAPVGRASQKAVRI